MKCRPLSQPIRVVSFVCRNVDRIKAPIRVMGLLVLTQTVWSCIPAGQVDQFASDWFSTVLIRIFFWCKNLQIYKGGVALGYGS